MKHHVKYHEFFLNPLMTQPSKPHHFLVYQALIGNHRSLEILDNLITKFCKQFDFLTVVRRLNFLSLRTIQEQLSMLSLALISIFICFRKLVNPGLLCCNLSKLHGWFGTLELLLEWHLFMQILLTMWNVPLFWRHFLAQQNYGFDTTLHKFTVTVTYPMFLLYFTIFHQMIPISLVLKHIINSLMVKVS